MKYKLKVKQHTIKVDCNSKLSKLFNILQSIGFGPENCNTNYVKLVGKEYEVTWLKKDYDNSKDLILINKKNCFNNYKDSEYVVNISIYSLEEILEIIFKICNIDKVVDYTVSDSFFYTETKKIKLLDLPNSEFSTEIQDIKYSSLYKRNVSKKHNLQSKRTKIKPYGHIFHSSWDSSDTRYVSVVNKSTQRRLNKVNFYSNNLE
jgi:hypothetical protein